MPRAGRARGGAGRATRSTRRRRRTRGSLHLRRHARPARTRRSTSGRSPPAPPRSRARRPRAARARRRSTRSRARSSSAPRRSAPTGTRSRAFGDAVFRIQYTVAEHRDRDPQRRHHGPHAGGPLHGADHGRRPGPEADRLQLRPLRGRAAGLQPRHARRDSTTYYVGGRERALPAGVERLGPAVHVLGRLLRAQTARRTSPTWPGPAR